MKQDKFNKILLGLVIISIFVSLFGTFLVLDNVSSARVEGASDLSSGVVSLSIAGEPQGVVSSGVISLELVADDLEENMEE